MNQGCTYGEKCKNKHCMIETHVSPVRENSPVSTINFRSYSDKNTVFATCKDGSLTELSIGAENIGYFLQNPVDTIPGSIQLPMANDQDAPNDIGITAMNISTTYSFIALGYLSCLYSSAAADQISQAVYSMCNVHTGSLVLLTDENPTIELVISESQMYADEVRVNDIAMIEMNDVLYVFAAGESGKARQWQIQKPIQESIYGATLTFEGNMRGISSILAHQTQEAAYVFTGGKDKMIRAYDAGTAELYYTIGVTGLWAPSQQPPGIELQVAEDIVGHIQMITTFTLINVSGLEILVSGGYDNLLKCWTLDGALIHTQKYMHPDKEHTMKINCITQMQTAVGLFLLVGHGQSKANPNHNAQPLQGYGLTIIEVLEDTNGPSFRLCGEFNKQYKEVTKIVVLDEASFVLSYSDGNVGVYYIENPLALKGS